MRLKAENLYLLSVAAIVGIYLVLTIFFRRGLFYAVGIDICKGRAVSEFFGRSAWPVYAMEYFYILSFVLIIVSAYLWYKHKMRDGLFMCVLLIFMMCLAIFAGYFMSPTEKTPMRLGQIFYSFSPFVTLMHWKIFRDWRTGAGEK